jgi:hypothetical protein
MLAWLLWLLVNLSKVEVKIEVGLLVWLKQEGSSVKTSGVGAENVMGRSGHAS